MLTLVVCASPFTGLGPSPTLQQPVGYGLSLLWVTQKGKVCSLVDSDSCDLQLKSLLIGGSIRLLMGKKKFLVEIITNR